jgi:hypothetical protein
MWNGSRWIHPAVRRAIYVRDGHACMYCGARESARCKLSLDHVVPKCLGGADEPENLVTVCCRCNFRRQDKSLEAFFAVLSAEGKQTGLIAGKVQTAIATPIDLAAGKAEQREINRIAREVRAARKAAKAA